MKYVQSIVVVLAVMLACAGFGFFGDALNFMSASFWQPRQQNLQRTIYQNTDSFTRGMAGDLQNLHLQYLQAKDPDVKATIVATVLQRTSGVNLYNLNDPSLSAWVQSLRDGGQ
jgi:hypothetical protein